MPTREKKKIHSGTKLALTIIIGIFIAIMIITLFNLIVTYFYKVPTYNDFCNGIGASPYTGANPEQCANCTFSTDLQEQTNNCTEANGIAIYDYNDRGCIIDLKECNLCNQNYQNATTVYNRNTFFVYAAIGFALIVAGLFISTLLIQIIALPAGAFLVIEAAIKNFDDKLYIIITFSLLIIAAIFLALKKLK